MLGQCHHFTIVLLTPLSDAMALIIRSFYILLLFDVFHILLNPSQHSIKECMLPSRVLNNNLHNLALLMLSFNPLSPAQPPEIQFPQVENKVHFFCCVMTVLHLGRSASSWLNKAMKKKISKHQQ